MFKNEFIDGIHNYCDRWCEHCDYTRVCRVFHDTEKGRRRHERRGEDPTSLDIAMKDVGRNLAKAHRLLARFAKREGVNLDDLAKEGAADRSWRVRPKRQDRPLIKQADKLMLGCRDLLDAMRPQFGDEADGVNQRAGFMDVSGEADSLNRVRGAFEMICWDHMLIAVKLRRALEGVAEAEQDDEDMRDLHAYDSAGSAAVVRRSLQRTQAALQIIYDWDEALRDRVIDLLVTAERLLRGIESRIPDCRTFTFPPPVRPWLEDEQEDGDGGRPGGGRLN